MDSECSVLHCTQQQSRSAVHIFTENEITSEVPSIRAAPRAELSLQQPVPASQVRQVYSDNAQILLCITSTLRWLLEWP